MQYDVEIRDGDKTIHGLTHEQVKEIKCVLGWANVQYTIHENAEAEALEYLRANCKPKIAVAPVVNHFLTNPKHTRACLRWNGSMASKFLRLAGVWDTLSKTEKNIILGYEVARDEQLSDPRDPGGGY